MIFKNTFFFVMLLVNIMIAKDYHVSTTGNDDSTGAINFPFKTISKLLLVIKGSSTGFTLGYTQLYNYNNSYKKKINSYIKGLK